MLKLQDRVKELTTTSGTGTLTLSGTAEAGFQAFSVLGNNTKTYYAISDVNGTDFEVGEGTYNSNTLTRDTIFESSNSGNAISLSATGSTVFVTYPAEKSSYRDIGVNRDYTASGSITAGKPLILNADNTVSQVAETSVSFAVNTSQEIATSSSNDDYQVVYDTYRNKALAIYRNGASPYNVLYKVGTIDTSANSITWGTAGNVNTTGTHNVRAVYDEVQQATIVFYNDNNTSPQTGKCLAITLDASGNATVGSTGTFSSNPVDSVSATYCQGVGTVVAYDVSSGNFESRVVTVSGTTVTVGASHTVTTNGIVKSSVAYDTANSKVVVVYSDSTNGYYSTYAVGSISGTTVTYGTPAVFISSSTPRLFNNYALVFDKENSKFIYNGYTSDTGQIYVGSLSGTTVTWGSAQQYSTTSHSQTISYNPATKNTLLGYRNTSTNYPVARTITLNGSTATFGTETNLSTINVSGNLIQTNSANTKSIASYIDNSNNNYDGNVVSMPSSSTNLSKDNFFGVASSTASTTEPVGVNRAGSFNNDQSGMTAGVDQYVTDTGLIKERATTTTTPDTNPSFNFQEATSNTTGNNPTSTYEATSGAYVVAWKELSNSYGYVMAGTISNGTMTWGTPTAFFSGAIDDVPNICSGGGAVHITYRSGTNGVIKWATISGTTITLASGGDLFNHGGSYSFPMGYRCAYDTANNYVMVFYSGGSGTQTAYVQPMYYNSSAGSYTGSTSSIVKSSIQILTQVSEIVYDSDTERFVVFYRDTTNSNVGYANVIQSTGTSASPTASVGSASQFTNGDQIISYGNIGGVYDTQNDKVFIAWNNTDGSNPSWKGAIITVTGGGTNTIASTGWADIWDYASGGSTGGIAFDSDKNKIMFYYRDDANSDYLTYKTITSGASSFTVANGAVIKESDNQFQGNSPSFAPSKNVVLPTRDLGNSNKISSVTTYFGSTTSTVVNGSQFVGTARSGTDLELSEPPTELVSMANGSITKGKPVNLRTDGDFEQVKETETTTSTTETIGTEIQLSNGESGEFETAHNNNGTFLVVYRFQTTGRMHARLGTYSSSGVIAWGTDLTLTKPAGQQQATACYYDSDNDCFVVIGGTGLNEYIYATILTYSGVTLTEGNFVEFEAQDQNNNGVSDMSASYDTTNKIGYVVVGGYGDSITKLTVSGTSITASAFQYVFGSYTGSRMQYASLDYDIPNNTGVIYFRDSSNSYYPTVLAFTSASGTLTFGTKVALVSVQYGKQGSVAHNSTHTFVAYGNSADLTKVYYNNLSISGTSITVGTQAVLITSANIGNKSSKPFIYNPDGKFYYVFSQTSSPYNLSLVEATASGTSLSGSFKFQQSKSSLYEKWTIGNTSISNGTMILAGYDSGNTDAKAITFTPTATITTITNNLSSNNFIGFAQDTVADNEDVKVKTVSQSDENQTGLTTASQYYVQVDGTLSTTAGTPSVLGGTALSSTKILIKS